ncbi:hypothetical protein JG687_00016565, partial [Phytophthora cactorum]
MPSPSDSEDGKGKKQKGYKIGSSGTPVNRNGDDGTFYKHAMLNAFEMSDVRSHLYTLFDIKDELEDLKAPVNNLQMVDLMLRSLPT